MSTKHHFLTHTDRLTVVVRNRTGNAALIPSADVIASAALPDGRLRLIVYPDAVPHQMPVSEWWRVIIVSREQALKVASVQQNTDGTVVVLADATPIFTAEREAIHRVLVR